MISDIDRLVAIEDIKTLQYKFFRAVDYEKDKIAGLLTHDVRISFSDETPAEAVKLTQPVVLNGPDTFVSFLKQFVGAERSVHLGLMPQIEFDSADKANGIWWIQGVGTDPKARGLKIGLGFETMECDYVRIDGKWLISSLSARIQVHM
ncbi:Bile acid 7-alpha dehydratase [Burkholderia lata]|uniref:nuclear transport factor 2 family protein n=1 Tax=Burkholderia lata (strain ATCC 17760 / DSM 23089 / LMG 22485 / NCIMB 9086 / R18194 / 383) TaxID=482957 RepID=UPI001453756B|nr:nuclear transport factor 2 family protein [Burkholderia lata]VWB38931.1 Bile acid 7-alpha dehydratase [Burkholderia lata]